MIHTQVSKPFSFWDSRHPLFHKGVSCHLNISENIREALKQTVRKSDLLIWLLHFERLEEQSLMKRKASKEKVLHGTTSR